MIVGAILLFKLRKSAVVVFGLLLGLTAVDDLVKFLTNDMTLVIGRFAVALACLGLALEATVLFYVLRLRRRGILT